MIARSPTSAKTSPSLYSWGFNIMSLSTGEKARQLFGRRFHQPPEVRARDIFPSSEKSESPLQKTTPSCKNHHGGAGTSDDIGGFGASFHGFDSITVSWLARWGKFSGPAIRNAVVPAEKQHGTPCTLKRVASILPHILQP